MPVQSAILDIVTSRLTNVLYLEHEFINLENDKSFVINRAGKRMDIVVGRQNDTAMEIKSGLKEGDEAEQVDPFRILQLAAGIKAIVGACRVRRPRSLP